MAAKQPETVKLHVATYICFCVRLQLQRLCLTIYLTESVLFGV